MDIDLMSITSLEPVASEIMGSSYFNLLDISSTGKAQDLRNFEKFTILAKLEKTQILAPKKRILQFCQENVLRLNCLNM